MASRVRIRKVITKITVPLASGAVGYQGGEVGVLVGTHTCGPVSGATNEKALGTALKDYSQTAGDTYVEIELHQPVELEYFTNGNSLTIASNFLGHVYFSAADTVTSVTNSGGVNYAFAGIVYDVSTTDGVGVKRVSTEIGELLS